MRPSERRTTLNRPNPFIDGGEDYARSRPTYPLELVQVLAELCDGRGHAVDVGCGTGQLSGPLAAIFEKVTAIDPSNSQIANTKAHPRIEYRVGTAEKIDLPDHSADLVVAAQAAHWFDLDRFYAEACRILRARGTLALVTYGVPTLDGPAGARFDRFYWRDIHQYWPDERRHVEARYKTLPFPFEESALPDLAIIRDWTFDELSAYIGTWSAIRAARAAGASDTIGGALSEIAAAWGNQAMEYRITWPICGRIAIP
jgi:SAM-dependent methyltransferase